MTGVATDGNGFFFLSVASNNSKKSRLKRKITPCFLGVATVATDKSNIYIYIFIFICILIGLRKNN